MHLLQQRALLRGEPSQREFLEIDGHIDGDAARRALARDGKVDQGIAFGQRGGHHGFVFDRAFARDHQGIEHPLDRLRP